MQLRSVLVGCGFVALCAAVAAFRVGETPAPAPSAQASPPGPRAWPDDMVASHLVETRLRDPRSAAYRHQTVEYQAGGDRVVCGEVNARNGFGGMAGYSRFLVVDQAVFLQGDEGFRPIWARYCGQGR